MNVKKSLFSLVLVISLLFSLAFMLPVSAADKVVFVKDGGTGDGTSADKAFGGLDDAYKSLGADGGTIVICGQLTLPKGLYAYEVPVAHTGTVTITSVYGGQDYRKSGGSDVMNLYFDNDAHKHFYISGPTVFINLNIYSPMINIFAARNHKLVFDEGIKMFWPEEKQICEIYVLGGSNNNNQGVTIFTDIPDGANTEIILKSGTYDIVAGGHRFMTDRNIGNTNINVSGSALVNKLILGHTGGGGTVNNITATIDGGVIKTYIEATSTKDITGTSSVIFTKNFDSSKSLLPYENIAGEEVKCYIKAVGGAKSVFNYTNNNLSADFLSKIDTANPFTEVLEYVKVETPAGSTSTGGGLSPQTSDNTIIVTLFIFGMTLCAVPFISKKRHN